MSVWKSAKEILGPSWDHAKQDAYQKTALYKYYGNDTTKIQEEFYHGKPASVRKHARLLEELMKRDMPQIMDKIKWLNRSPMSIHHWRWEGTDKLFKNWPNWFPDKMSIANYATAITNLEDKLAKKVSSMLATGSYKMKRAFFKMVEKGAVKARTRTAVRSALNKLSHFRKSFRGLIPSTRTPRGQAALSIIKKHLAPKLAEKLVVVRRRIKHRKMTEKWAQIRAERAAHAEQEREKILAALRGWGDTPMGNGRGFQDDYPATVPMKVVHDLIDLESPTVPPPPTPHHVGHTPIMTQLHTPLPPLTPFPTAQHHPLPYPPSPPHTVEAPTPLLSPPPKRRGMLGYLGTPHHTPHTVKPKRLFEGEATPMTFLERMGKTHRAPKPFDPRHPHR